MKLQTKLLILYVLCTILIMLALGDVFYSRLWDERLESIRKDLSNQLQHADFALSSFFAEVGNDVSTLAANELVWTRNDRDFTSFLNADEKTFEYHIQEPEQKIIDIFNNYRMTHPYVNSVYMGRENGSFVRSHKRARPTRYDPRERPWYVTAKNNPGRVMETEVYPSVTTSDVNIGFVKALVDGDGAVYGVVGVDVTLVNLTNYISNFKTSPPGKIILLDRKGTVLAGLKRELLFKNVSNYSAALARILTEAGPEHPSVSIDDEKYYVFSRAAMHQDWKIAVLIPSGKIEEQIIGQIILTISGLAIGLALLSFLTLVGLNIYVTKPLKRFIDETDYIARTSNLERHIDITSKDEIGALARSYNDMIDALSFTYKSLKDTETELIAHRDHLEQLVNERTSSLQEANERLSAEIEEHKLTMLALAVEKERAEVADRLKSAFLATMSHELRTPLNSIIGFTGIILQGLVGPLNDEQKKQLNMVRGSAQHLLSLINDVLDISKIEAGQLQLSHEDFDLRGAVEKVVESTRPIAAKKGLKLTGTCSVDIGTMKGDVRRVEQILLNLLSNAIKFTETGSVTVQCESDERNVTVKVIDTGIGIRTEDMETLFKAFRQIDSGITRKYEGTGLGLSICRRLVELMGGSIWVTSEWGSGSTFGFSLPKERDDSNETDTDRR